MGFSVMLFTLISSYLCFSCLSKNAIRNDRIGQRVKNRSKLVDRKSLLITKGAGLPVL